MLSFPSKIRKLLRYSAQMVLRSSWAKKNTVLEMKKNQRKVLITTLKPTHRELAISALSSVGLPPDPEGKTQWFLNVASGR